MSTNIGRLRNRPALLLTPLVPGIKLAEMQSADLFRQRRFRLAQIQGPGQISTAQTNLTLLDTAIGLAANLGQITGNLRPPRLTALQHSLNATNQSFDPDDRHGGIY